MISRLAVAVLFASSLLAYAASSIGVPALSPSDLLAAGRYQLAADALVQMLRDTHVPGQEDENRAAMMVNLGLAYEKLGNYTEAEATLGKAIQVYKDLRFTQTLCYARTLTNLGTVYLDEKRYPKAEEMFKDTLAMYRQYLPDNPHDIALALNNLGLVRLSLGDTVQAERYFRESLDLQRQTHDTTLFAVTLNNLALGCKRTGLLEEATTMYTQAIDVWRSTVGSSHPEIAVGLHNLARLEAALGKKEAAEKHFQEALTIVNATLPPQHPTRTAILSGYADLLLKTGRKREAKQLRLTARNLQAKHDHENFQDLTVDVQSLR